MVMSDCRSDLTTSAFTPGFSEAVAAGATPALAASRSFGSEDKLRVWPAKQPQTPRTCGACSFKPSKVLLSVDVCCASPVYCVLLLFVTSSRFVDYLFGAV